jgi:UDP-2-acetamido-2,6-beta-L-arabino-hexul-4-ose reductase
MKLAVTGAGGFLGWHVRCRAFAHNLACVPIGRETMADPQRLAAALRGVDAVLHCAGANRGSDQQVVDGNLTAAKCLAEAVRRAGRPIRIVYANSIRSGEDTVYGVVKRKAGELLAGAVPDDFSDVLLPNLFGEHARPYYNSFVATFCRDVAGGRRPAEVRDAEVALLHAQDAADVLIRQAYATGCRSVEPAGEPVRVTAVLRLLQDFAATYRSGEIPYIAGQFRTQLFNTYRSYLFPQGYPIALPRRSDARGDLVECVRSGATGGQAFFSATVPGAVRGEHVHLRKFERFVVVDGRAEIALRRLFTDRVIRFQVEGGRPVIVDMPTMWVHRLANLDTRPLTTLFWTSELFRPSDPDTFPCLVGGKAGGP